MIDVLFASNNRGKYDELVNDFKDEGINLIYDGNLKLIEDAETLRENSWEKAIQAAKQRNMYALSDDSGVFIEALDYFPGVHSRRWTGKENDDSLRNEKILEMMEGESDRDAFLISRFALADSSQKILGNYVVKNKFIVSTKEKGNHGFGYDRILQPSEEMLKHYMSLCPAYGKDDYNYFLWSETAEKIEKENLVIAELTQQQKNDICNRGRIAKDVKKTLDFYTIGKDGQ